MPKRLPRNKKSVPASGALSDYGKRGPLSVKDLLTTSVFSLTKSKQIIERKGLLLNRVREQLPEELRPHVLRASQDGTILTLYCASSAWGARLRLHVAPWPRETLQALAPGSQTARVRIAPVGAAE
jgi:hypothetical protein